MTSGGASAVPTWATAGGGVTFPLEGSDGTAAAPTYSFSSDDNNGMYLSGGDTLSLSSGGLEKLRLDGTGVSIRSGGRLGLETGQVSNPAIRWNDATNMGFYKDGSTAVSFTSGGVRQSTFDSSGRLRLGNGSASNLTTYGTNLVLDTDVGVDSGSIIIAQGLNGQISLNPNGSGTVKIDGVEIDNSAIATGKILKASSSTVAGWVTEGGGGGAAFTPVAFESTGYAIMGQAPYGNASYGTSSIQNTSIFYHPFIAPRDMTVNTTYLYISGASSSGAKADVAIYSNKESISEPETLLCKISIGTGSTGYNSSSSWTSTSTLNLTGGTTYWMAHTGASGSADTFYFQSVASSARAAVAKSVGNASQNCLVDAASGALGFPVTPNVSQFNRSPMCIFIEAL